MYGKKVRKLESAEYLAVNKPALELNVGAANRFISHAIPDLSREQKVALKEVRCIPTSCLATHQSHSHSTTPYPCTIRTLIWSVQGDGYESPDTSSLALGM